MSAGRSRRAVLFVLALAFAAVVAQAQQAVVYQIHFADAAQHRLHVAIRPVQTQAGTVLQLPVWNALYQVRDFSQYVTAVFAHTASGDPVPIVPRDKSSWQLAPAAPGVIVEYDVVADRPGPFDADFNSEHAFLNLAQVLMYPVADRQTPALLILADVPGDWEMATALAPGTRPNMYTAPNYDALVDAPVQLGSLDVQDTNDGSANYTIAVDGDSHDYDIASVMLTVRRVTRAALEWMDDRPCDRYVFLYRFRSGGGAGGMEHACSTAIDLNPDRGGKDSVALAGVTAHEFFHQWNVKRIRPAGLEPVDYTRENYTRALWFSEGVTNTVEEILLTRAGLLDEQAFLRRLAYAIRTLETRPAARMQSAEASSLEAWLEKYPAYNRPGRSVSYYNKGEVLGYLLDLAMRDATRGTKSLRDLFQYLNLTYAKQGRPFAEENGLREAVEAVTGANFREFFASYVAGTAPLPYDKYFATVGLQLVRTPRAVTAAGFDAQHDFDGRLLVTSVDANSDAARAGLAPGMLIVHSDAPAGRTMQDAVAQMKPGDTLHLRVRARNGERELAFKVGSKESFDLVLQSAGGATPQQVARRKAWMRGESEPAAVPAAKGR